MLDSFNTTYAHENRTWLETEYQVPVIFAVVFMRAPYGELSKGLGF